MSAQALLAAQELVNAYRKTLSSGDSVGDPVERALLHNTVVSSMREARYRLRTRINGGEPIAAQLDAQLAELERRDTVQKVLDKAPSFILAAIKFGGGPAVILASIGAIVQGLVIYGEENAQAITRFLVGGPVLLWVGRAMPGIFEEFQRSWLEASNLGASARATLSQSLDAQERAFFLASGGGGASRLALNNASTLALLVIAATAGLILLVIGLVAYGVLAATVSDAQQVPVPSPIFPRSDTP